MLLCEFYRIVAQVFVCQHLVIINIKRIGISWRCFFRFDFFGIVYEDTAHNIFHKRIICNQVDFRINSKFLFCSTQHSSKTHNTQLELECDFPGYSTPLRTEIFCHPRFGDGSRALSIQHFPFATTEILIDLSGYLDLVLFALESILQYPSPGF